jgi:hypothetical protein
VTNVPVTLQIVPLHDAPTITYLADPTLCTQQPGYIDKDLCVTPKDTFPLTPGTTYVDQTYGATVKILTDGPVAHPYSTPNPLSANNKYILTYDNNGWINVMLVADGSMASFHAGTSAQSWWDVTDDDTFYYPNGPRIMKHSVSTGAESAVVDYTGRFSSVTRGGTGDSSKDNWISFWSSPEHNVCAVNLATTDTYCADYTLNFGNLPIPVIDFTLISKGVDTTSGKRYVIINGWPSNMVYTVNMTTKALDFEYRGPELPRGNNNHDGVCDPGEACWYGSHTDTLEVNGIQYMVFNDYYNSPCEFDIQTVQLNKGASLIKQMEIGGGRKSVFNLWSCGPGWVDEHVACAKNAPYCVISTQSYGRASTDTTPIVNTPHDNAIIVMTGNGDGITPIAKSHTIKFTDAGGDLWYWGIPRASISNDGSCVVWDSDYGTFQQRVSISCWK